MEKPLLGRTLRVPPIRLDNSWRSCPHPHSLYECQDLFFFVGEEETRGSLTGAVFVSLRWPVLLFGVLVGLPVGLLFGRAV